MISLLSLVVVGSTNATEYQEVQAVARGIISWVTLFAGYILFSTFSGSVTNVVKLANCIYIFFAVLQFSGIDTSSFIVESRTSLGRGVTSLAPEPTFFGLVLLFFVIYFLGIVRLYRWVVVNVIFLIFASKSSTAVLALLPILLIFSVRESYIKVLVVFCVSIALAYVLYNYDFGRISLLLRAVGDIERLIVSDYSVRIRLADIVLTPFMMLHNCFLPISFDQVSSVRMSVGQNVMDGVFYYQSLMNKTNSYLSFFLLTGGGYSLILLMALFVLSRAKSIFSATLILAIFSVPPGTIFIPFLIAQTFRRKDV